jgi:hypothetical protein
MSSQFKTGPIRYGHESFLIPLQTTRPIMRLKSFVRSKRRVITFGLLAGGVAARAQTVMNPNPNAVFSWNWADWSTINPTDLAVSPGHELGGCARLRNRLLRQTSRSIRTCRRYSIACGVRIDLSVWRKV